MSRVEQLLNRRQVTTEGCWEWTGSRNPSGYGLVTWNGRTMRVHRVAYEQYIGPIPTGLTIDHLCRNTSCFNPEHLEALTLTENILRSSGLAAQNATKTHCPKGHEYTPETTRVWKGNRDCRECQRDWQRTKRVRRPAGQVRCDLCGELRDRSSISRHKRTVHAEGGA